MNPLNQILNDLDTKIQKTSSEYNAETNHESKLILENKLGSLLITKNELHQKIRKGVNETPSDIDQMLAWWRGLNSSEKELVKEMGAKVIELAKENDPTAVEFLKEQGYNIDNIIMPNATF